MCSLVFFTRTHIRDTTLPSWADSDDAIAFLSEVLKLEPMDFLAKFEQWACTRTKGMYGAAHTQKYTNDYHQLIALKRIFETSGPIALA